MTAGDPIAGAVETFVIAGTLAGAATVVWRAGTIVHDACVGWRDEARALPIARDSLFRIASMSKPVTSTAALMLLDEGRFALIDPIARWAPVEDRVPGHGYELWGAAFCCSWHRCFVAPTAPPRA